MIKQQSVLRNCLTTVFASTLFLACAGLACERVPLLDQQPIWVASAAVHGQKILIADPYGEVDDRGLPLQGKGKVLVYSDDGVLDSGKSIFDQPRPMRGVEYRDGFLKFHKGPRVEWFNASLDYVDESILGHDEGAEGYTVKSIHHLAVSDAGKVFGYGYVYDRGLDEGLYTFFSQQLQFPGNGVGQDELPIQIFESHLVNNEYYVLGTDLVAVKGNIGYYVELGMADTLPRLFYVELNDPNAHPWELVGLPGEPLSDFTTLGEDGRGLMPHAVFKKVQGLDLPVALGSHGAFLYQLRRKENGESMQWMLSKLAVNRQRGEVTVKSETVIDSAAPHLSMALGGGKGILHRARGDPP